MLRSSRGGPRLLSRGIANTTTTLGPSGHALLGGARLAELGDEVDVVVELYAARAVEFDLLEGLADDIVRLSLRRLRGFDGRCLVDVALIVDVEFAKGVGQTEDFALLELRVLPSPWRRWLVLK